MKCVDSLLTMEGTVSEERTVLVEEVLVCLCQGWYLEVGGNGVLTYHGKSSNYIWLQQNMGVGNVLKLAEEAMQEGLREHRLWNNAQFDCSMIMSLHRDADVGKLIKGNDEFVYVCCREGGPKSSTDASQPIKRCQ